MLSPLSIFYSSPVAITWTNAPENQFPTLGTNYVVKCEVKADPNPTIDWLRNGDPVSEKPQSYNSTSALETP